MKKLLVLFLFGCHLWSFSQTTIVPANSVWLYLDNGTNQGTAWQDPGFSDVSWSSGNAELGYGDGDEITTVSYGPSSSDKYITTYFRKTFSITDASVFSYLEVNLVCDDGCVVYLNGQEVVRQNMPSGAISYTTEASSTIALTAEDNWTTNAISALHLVDGNNTLAIEVHQDDPESSDISFNAKLIGYTAPQSTTLERGPYLQKANQNQVYVCWRTEESTDSKVYYGTDPNNLNQLAVDTDFETAHFVKIDGLDENTVYYYQIGNNSETYSAVAPQYFKTHPAEGSEGAYRFWVIGDSGMGNGNQESVTDAFYAYNNSEHIDGWLMLGDNAYESGFDSEYQAGFFEEYPDFLPNTVVWPAPGNHDYNNHIPFSPDPAYYNIFNLPTQAEAGGLASGTEKYYSWNFGNVHFISLDSYDEGRATNDPMAVWLENDLAQNTLPWIVAYWHHPPYTKGSHDSDDWLLDGELIDMRENILPILESYGVDLVLNGHSHCYERSHLIDGHYGDSDSFNASAHSLDANSGDYVNDCPYIKNTENGSGHQGTVAAVVGCSGKLSGTSSGWPHPVFYKYTNTNMGSMLMEVNGNRMDCKFVITSGEVYDQFTIIKNPQTQSTVSVCQGEQVKLTPNFGGTAHWYPSGLTTDSLTITAMIPSTYIATDDLGCLKDTIQVQIEDPANCGLGFSVNNNIENDELVTLQQNLINQQTPITVVFDPSLFHRSYHIHLINVNGQIVMNQLLEDLNSSQVVFSQLNLSSGMYFIRVTDQENGEWQQIPLTIQ